MFDYFYGNEPDSFMFYRIPKLMFKLEAFRNLTTEAKVLYGLLLDRISLSVENGWADDKGRVYIIYTVNEAMRAFSCSQNKAISMFKELENICLIEKKKRGLGRPNLIYVKNFLTGHQEMMFKNLRNESPAGAENEVTEPQFREAINTEKNDTEMNETYPYLIADDMNDRDSYRETIKRNIQFDPLLEKYPYEHELINEILELIVDVLCSNSKRIRIGGDDKPSKVVKEALASLEYEHIAYVIDSFKENTTRIKNIRQYMLASLYNSRFTISAHYSAMYNHDRANGLI